MNRNWNRESLINVNGFDIVKTAGKELDREVRIASSADTESGAAKALEFQPAAADERTSIAGGFGVEVPEDLKDEPVRETIVNPILASHVK